MQIFQWSPTIAVVFSRFHTFQLKAKIACFSGCFFFLSPPLLWIFILHQSVMLSSTSGHATSCTTHLLVSACCKTASHMTSSCLYSCWFSYVFVLNVPMKKAHNNKIKICKNCIKYFTGFFLFPLILFYNNTIFVVVVVFCFCFCFIIIILINKFFY